MPAGGLVVGAAISLGLGALKTGLGFGKKAKAKRMKRRAQATFDKNKFDVPESAKASLQSAQRRASKVGLAGQDIIEAQMGQSTAQGVKQAQSAATSSSDVLGMLSSLYGNQQLQQQNLGLQAAQQYDKNQIALQSSLGQMANWENQNGNITYYIHINNKWAAAGQMRSEATNTINAGISGIASSASSLVGGLSAANGLSQQSLGMQKMGNTVMSAPQHMATQPIVNPYNQGQLEGQQPFIQNSYNQGGLMGMSNYGG